MNNTLVADLYAPYPADVFLFHPTDRRQFVVGTYLLDETTKRRHGKLCVYQLLASDTGVARSGARQVQEIECDAILDMKWHDSCLFVAHSTGSLSVYKASDRNAQPVLNLELLRCKTVIDEDILIMSLSVSQRGVLTSHSDGTVALWTHDLEGEARIRVADLEVWIQSWSADGQLIYSGSDDGNFAAWDVRQPCDTNHSLPVFENKRAHKAGVTAIVASGDGQTILTGSYDDHIRLFDIRNPRKSVRQQNLGGGVWRIIPRSEDELVICCMYAGAKVIQRDTFAILQEWQQHESIVYGGDVSGDLIGTCSFYDKRVCVWS